MLISGCSSSATKRPFSQRIDNLTNLQAKHLTEQEVLDIDSTLEITEHDIHRAVKIAKSQIFKLTPKSKIVLVQSGATVPDTAMQEAMMKYYRVSVYSGIPQVKISSKFIKKNEQTYIPPQNTYIKRLRLAAARAKQDKIIVYWGKMELGRMDSENKTLIWDSYYGGDIPSATEYLRYLVRFALVDVNTGMWAMYSSINKEVPYKKRGINSTNHDMTQISKVKADAYALAVQNLSVQFE